MLLENWSPKSSGASVGLWNRNREKACAVCVQKSGETEGEDKWVVGRDAGKETETENLSRVQTWYYPWPDN